MKDPTRPVRGQEPRWLFNVLSWFLLLAGWCASAIFTHRISSSGTRQISRQGKILFLATHRSLLDSFIIGALLWGVVTMFFKPRLALWNIPEGSNFKLGPVSSFLIKHWHCVPIKRDQRAQIMEVHRTIRDLLENKGNVLLFPTAGRERNDRPVKIDKFIGKLVYELLQLNHDLQIVAVRIDGMSIWNGQRMQGTKWQRWKQFHQTVIKQTSGRNIHVAFNPLDLSQFRNCEANDETYLQIVLVIAAAIKAHYPQNPAEESDVSEPKPYPA